MIRADEGEPCARPHRFRGCPRHVSCVKVPENRKKVPTRSIALFHSGLRVHPFTVISGTSEATRWATSADASESTTVLGESPPQLLLNLGSALHPVVVGVDRRAPGASTEPRRARRCARLSRESVRRAPYGSRSRGRRSPGQGQDTPASSRSRCRFTCPRSAPCPRTWARRDLVPARPCRSNSSAPRPCRPYSPTPCPSLDWPRRRSAPPRRA